MDHLDLGVALVRFEKGSPILCDYAVAVEEEFLEVNVVEWDPHVVENAIELICVFVELECDGFIVRQSMVLFRFV